MKHQSVCLLPNSKCDVLYHLPRLILGGNQASDSNNSEEEMAALSRGKPGSTRVESAVASLNALIANSTRKRAPSTCSESDSSDDSDTDGVATPSASAGKKRWSSLPSSAGNAGLQGGSDTDGLASPSASPAKSTRSSVGLSTVVPAAATKGKQRKPKPTSRCVSWDDNKDVLRLVGVILNDKEGFQGRDGNLTRHDKEA